MEKRWLELDKQNDKKGMQERWDIIIKNICEVGRELKMVKEIKRGEGVERDGDIRE